MARLLFIDNFDSFTYNLVDEFRCLNHQVTVIRNHVDIDDAERLALEHDAVIISPGPGNPQQAGICLSLVKRLAGNKPILGICLGHQLIVESFGGKVDRAPVPVHGKASLVNHNQSGCFANLPNPFNVGRYHSLIALDVPEGFEVTATVKDSEQELVMAVHHKEKKLLGFQFHPESVLTTQGSRLLEDSINMLLNHKEL